MKALQVAVFAATGCLLIWSGYREGYGIALLSALSAFVVTIIVPEAYADIRMPLLKLATPKKGGNGPAQ
ncbi:hypothetical protein WDZ92_43420 [Nostoc sp. NIES-2111]